MRQARSSRNMRAWQGARGMQPIFLWPHAGPCRIRKILAGTLVTQTVTDTQARQARHLPNAACASASDMSNPSPTEASAVQLQESTECPSEATSSRRC